MNAHFTLQYWLDDGWYVGKIAEIPSVFSQGETLEELISNIKEVYHLMFFYDGAEVKTNQDITEMELVI